MLTIDFSGAMARALLLLDRNDEARPLVEAVHSAHAFVFDASIERLSVARSRVVALLVDLAGGDGTAAR